MLEFSSRENAIGELVDGQMLHFRRVDVLSLNGPGSQSSECLLVFLFYRRTLAYGETAYEYSECCDNMPHISYCLKVKRSLTGLNVAYGYARQDMSTVGFAYQPRPANASLLLPYELHPHRS